MNVKTPRIVIYGAGQYGQYITRFARQKGWPIVAAFNRVGDKVGKDLGQLAGIGEIGVIVQDCDTADFSSLDADIGVVTVTNLLKTNHQAHTRLLNAGLNVICHGGESYFPYGNDAEIAAKLDEVARKNGVTFTGSGIWDMSRIWSGILVAGPCTEIKSLYHYSVSDVNDGQVNRDQARLMVGNSLSVEEFNAGGFGNNPNTKAYKTIPEHVLHALGFHITHQKFYVEPVIFDKDFDSELMGGVIPAGHCVGSRIVSEFETREGVTAKSQIELRECHKGEIEHMLWSVEGKPSSKIITERKDSAHATAACLFNRIPDVINAPPGIVLVSQLGPLKNTALI